VPNRRVVVPLVAAMAVGASLALVAAPADAAPLPDNMQKFANCPVNDPTVATCIYIETTESKLAVGSIDLDSDSPIVMQFGVRYDPATNEPTTVAPINGAPVFEAEPIEIPGGLLGIPGSEVGPLAAYALPEIVGLPKVNVNAVGQQQGTALSIDLKAKVMNPFTDALTALGTKCHIGNDSDPMELRLTTGTTSPPAPNQPISGDRGTATTAGQAPGGLLIQDVKAVDNSYRAPGAHDCGLTGALNGVINLKGDLPSAAGKNSAELTANVYTMAAVLLRNKLNAAGDQVTDGDFEAAGKGPWACADQCGVDHGLGNAHAGDGNGWVRNNDNKWNDIHQTVAVAPNTDYTLTGWVRTSSNNTDGYFGVRKVDGTVVSEQKYGNVPGYTQQTVHLNSGDNTQLVVYGGVWALHGDTWAQFDDLSLTAD
jgi:hypothetical protein